MQESQKQNQTSVNPFTNKIVAYNQNQFRVGAFVFKSGITQEQIESLVTQKTGKLISVNSAYRYCKKQMVNVRVWLKFCTQWDHGILQLGNHGLNRFFNDFQNIALKNLLVLNLQNNNINSIQLIQNLEAPNLDCIYLHGNPIMTVKSFRKAHFPKMTRLYINALDNQYLSEFSNKILSLIQNSPRTPRKQFEWKKHNSIRWIAKIQSPNLRRIVRGVEKYMPNLDKQALTALNKKFQIN